MASKLTTAQRRVLTELAQRDGHASAWCYGTSTCEALRRRGLVEHAGGDRPFLSGWRDNQIVRITPAGRQALSGSKE